MKSVKSTNAPIPRLSQLGRKQQALFTYLPSWRNFSGSIAEKRLKVEESVQGSPCWNNSPSSTHLVSPVQVKRVLCKPTQQFALRTRENLTKLLRRPVIEYYVSMVAHPERRERS